MDLITEFGKTVEILRSNLILFLPVLIMLYLIPAALLITAAYILVPIVMVALKSASPLSVLFQGSLIGLAVIIAVAVLVYVYVISGSANMNKKAILTGSSSMDDFWEGCKKYTGRIIVGMVALAIIYSIIVAVGIILTVAMILPHIPRFSTAGFTPEFSPRAIAPEGFTRFVALLIEVLRVISDLLGIWLVLLTTIGLLLIFTLFWIQALVVDEVGAVKAIGTSIRFVRNNFKTTLGIVSLWIIAQGFTHTIFLGGGMDGRGLGYGHGFAFPQPLQAVFQLLIATFFTLLLYTVYMERTGKVPQFS